MIARRELVKVNDASERSEVSERDDDRIEREDREPNNRIRPEGVQLKTCLSYSY